MKSPSDPIWSRTLTAWNLASCGRTEAALRLAEEIPDFFPILSQKSGRLEFAEDMDPVVHGWWCYYRGKYRQALELFSERAFSFHAEGSWLNAWARLGMAKVASDAGWWQTGLQWCTSAWRAASCGEHLDLLAETLGARGEILLRAGFPMEAATAFLEDLALLPSGNRYRGRLRCYVAHAWSRLGTNGQRTAENTYRMAARTPNESLTIDFAEAGMAILGTRLQREDLLSPHAHHKGLPGFWITVCQAWFARNSQLKESLLLQAEQLLPDLYPAERWWLHAWAEALGHPLPDSENPSGLEMFPSDFPSPPTELNTLVASPLKNSIVNDAPWWRDERPSSSEMWWQWRDYFMP